MKCRCSGRRFYAEKCPCWRRRVQWQWIAWWCWALLVVALGIYGVVRRG